MKLRKHFPSILALTLASSITLASDGGEDRRETEKAIGTRLFEKTGEEFEVRIPYENAIETYPASDVGCEGPGNIKVFVSEARGKDEKPRAIILNPKACL